MRNGLNWKAYADMAREVQQNAFEDPYADELINPADLTQEFMDYYDNGYQPGISIGWSTLDQFITLRHGEFTVVTGHPGSGKSSWLDNVMINTARRSRWKWCVFSAENHPITRHLAGLSEIYSGKPFRPGPTQRMSKPEALAAKDWIGQYFRMVKPREDRYSLDRIMKLAFDTEFDFDGLLLDPWNEFETRRPRDTREDEFISDALTKLRWFARRAEVHVFLVAHPSKYIQQDGKPKPVATLNSVKGASEFYSKADNGVSIWRDELDPSNGSDVHVQKVRFREVGTLGVARLYYDKVSGRFIDPDHRPGVEELLERQRELEQRPVDMRDWRPRQPGEEG